MAKTLKIIYTIFLLFFSSAPLLHAVEPLKDPFYNQGQEIQNLPPVYSVEEAVDPFSGNLKLVHTDVHLPGNGGLDINILRTYDSSIWGRRDTSVFLGQKPNSPHGIGWSMHMGIVRNPDAMHFDTVFNSANPVVEMPDGSQHMLYSAKTGSNTFISKEGWIYTISVNGISHLTLTDGTVYTFQNNTVAGYWGWDMDNAQVTRIENAANNSWITIEYDKTSGVGLGVGYSYIDTITDSTGRHVFFDWDFGLHQLKSISLGNQTLISYLYDTQNTCPNTFGCFFMTEATPGGTSTSGNWKYSYYNDTSGQNLQMKTVTYPQGGTITYTFSDVEFKVASALTIPFSVVAQRKTGGLITAGTWTYQYVTGGASGNITTIFAPDNIKEVYNYNAWGNSISGYVWQVGLLLSKATYSGTSPTPIYSEEFDWDKSLNSISYDNLTSPSWTGGGSAHDIEIYVPLMGLKRITRDGKTYTTTYSDYDDYYNAKTIQETGGGIDRTTTVDYYWTNTSKNIVQNKPHSVTVAGTTTFPGSFVTSYLYDGTSGNVTRVTRYDVATGYHYDAYNGNLDYVTDANNKRTNFDWQYGRVSSKQNPIYTVSRSINANGTIASETDGRGYGYTTSYGYDANLRLRSITPPSGYGNVTTIDYPTDNSYKETTRGVYFTKTMYDGFGRATVTNDRKGIISTIAYKAYGQKSYSTSNVGDTVNYDFFGRVSSIVHRDNTSIGYTYLNGNVTVRDENGEDTTYTYAAFGNPDEKLLLRVTDALPAHNVTQYTYNILGSLTSIIQGGTTRSYVYDPTTNFLISETHPDRGSISYTLRDSVGNIKTKVEPSGTTKFDYDDINRLTIIKDINGLPIVSYTYDDADNRETMDNAGANIDYVFDKVNRLHQKTETIGARTYVTKYDYDANDNLEYITYPSGATRKVHYTYDDNNQAETVTAFGKNVVNDISYYTSVPNIGLPHVYTYANGHNVTFSYNNRNMTTRITAGASALDMGFDYDDPRGNTTTITNYLNHDQDKTLWYDELNRLRTLNNTWGEYTYDALGNRQTKRFGSNSTTYIYTNNRLTSTTSGETYGYAHNDGDITSINGTARSFVYDQLHNMTQFRQNGTPVADYTYDGDGMRMTKVAGGKTIIYHYDQGGRVLSENDDDNNLLADYVYLHGKLIAKITPPKPASPTNLRTWVAYTNQVDLYWDDNADNELGFFIERKLTTGGTYTIIGQAEANAEKYSDIDGTKIPGTSYTYQVRAFNQIGNSDFYTNEASGIPTSNPLAVMSVSPSSKAFGNVLKGSSSAPTTFTVTNQGSGNLIVTSITGITNFTVSADTCSNSTLYPRPDSTCTFTVSFAPTSGGLKNANVTIDTNLPDLLVPVSGNATLKLTVNNTNDHTSSGTITSSPSGIYCGPTCISTFNTYNLSSSVTLTATPSTDSFFAGWSGACTGTTGDCQVTMNDHKAVTALFKIIPAVAAFSASTTTVGVIPPTPITFTDQSLRAQSLTWDFGDGIIVTDLTPSANPTRTYSHAYTSVNSAGTYTVSLLATNLSGASLVTRTITVQPCSDLPARINRGNGATLINYPTLSDAYNAAINNDVIEALATNFIEDFNAGRDISVSINGGYTCGYTTKVGESTLQGTMTTSAGAVTIGDFEIVSGSTSNAYNIAASASVGGSISPAGTITLAQDESYTFSMTHEPGYQPLDVLVDGVSVPATDTYTFDNIATNHRIEARFYTTHTITASAGLNGDISPSDVSTVHSYDNETFTITPSTGYHIEDVLVDGGSVGALNSYTFQDIHADHIISATFAINTYTVTPSAGANGSSSPSTAQTVDYGSTTAFTVTPNMGYHLLTVTGCGGSLVGSTYTTGPITADCSVTATFAINTYTVTPSAGANGSISPSTPQTVNYNETIAFTVIPNAGYHLLSVTGCGGTLVGSIYTTGPVTADCSVAASFALNTYTVTPAAGAGGSISPNTPQTVNYNQTTAFTVTPNTGYLITSVTGCGGTLSGSTYTTGPVTTDCSVTASFAINTYTVTPSAGAGGSISPSTPQTVNYNQTTVFTVTPNTGYLITSVTGCGGTLSGSTYTTGAITSNCTVTATFAQQYVRIYGSSAVYHNIQEAYNAAGENAIIQVRNLTLEENPSTITINNPANVTIEGGYSSDWIITDTTNLKGMIQTTSTGGTLTIRNFVLQQ